MNSYVDKPVQRTTYKEVKRPIKVPVVIQDYQTIKKVEYKPVVRYIKKPIQRTEYRTEYKTEKVPQTYTDYVKVREHKVATLRDHGVLQALKMCLSLLSR